MPEEAFIQSKKEACAFTVTLAANGEHWARAFCPVPAWDSRSEKGNFPLSNSQVFKGRAGLKAYGNH